MKKNQNKDCNVDVNKEENSCNLYIFWVTFHVWIEEEYIS